VEARTAPAPEILDESGECIGCGTTCPTEASLLAHIRQCPQHPLRRDFARLRVLEQAIRDFSHAERALTTAASHQASTMDQWRALWQARDQLHVLAGEDPPAVRTQGQPDAAPRRGQLGTFSPNAPPPWTAAERAQREHARATRAEVESWT
jgi:hypothetical protein